MQQEINIAPAKDVSGNISVHLYEVPLNEALQAIILAGGCSYNKRSNLYYVYTQENDIDPEAERLQMRMFKLKYAEIENIHDILESFPNMRLIKTHEPSKTIIVEDTPENIAKIETLLEYWDTRPKQVVIEAKILEITLTDDMVMGVNWEKIIGDARIGTGGLSTATNAVGEGNSPVPSTGSGIFGNLITGAGSTYQFSLALDALETKTRVNALSAPKILAIHGKKAKVQVGGEQGYRVTTVNDGIATESIEFIQTGTILEITPYINDDGSVLLEIEPSIRSADIEEGIPVVKTTEVSTWLIANNGETIFLGGLIQNSKLISSKKVPLLGDIPLLGGLFSRNFRDNGKSELVILITPHVFNEDQNFAQQEAIEKTLIEEYFPEQPVRSHPQFLELLFPNFFPR